ncbi:apolipoprotein N-acyltransferase [Phaeobacter sp.]|uniref:apolipoprotein N-acyltransferase n=1 Tax=Phaeobacter sp. TaxID=1902409 RepID=UPI0025F53081|nr:apolipoprotein N-acyltransferase [Phaeobacter sp.]
MIQIDGDVVAAGGTGASRLLTYLGALVLGAGLALGLAPFHYVWLVPLCLGGVGALVLRAPTAKHAAILGCILGTAYFGVAMSWIYEPFQVDADRYAWMAPFAVLGLAFGLSLFWALAFGAVGAVARRRDVSSPRAAMARLCLLIGLWSLAEFGRAYLLTGLPWAAFGQFWIDTPVIHLLPYVGPHGLAVLTLLAGLPLALLRVRPVLALAPICVVCAVVLAAPKPPVAPLGSDVVRIVQPNAPQDEKWHPDLRWSFVRRQVAFTEASADPAIGAPDLIVWPETAVPMMLNDAEDVLAHIAKAAGDAQLLLGIQRRQDGRYYNSAVVLDPDGTPGQIYDKAHLVPFGEYIPAGNFMARFGIYGFASQAGAGYAAGPGPQILDLAVGKALPLICYEAVFPQDVNAAPERPAVLIQITNDAWFGTFSGPFQHLVQARMRAIEQGLPMVRVANTGVSAMIDPYGRVLKDIPLGEAGFVDAILPLPLPPTLYARTGDWPVFVLCVVLALGGVFFVSGRARRS